MVVAVKNNSKSGFYNSVDGTVEIETIKDRWPYSGFETPEELTGTSAISVGTYSGIEHSFVLDKNWAVVVVNLMDEVYDEIDTLSGGASSAAWDSYIASQIAGNPNFDDRNTAWSLRETYIGEARVNVGEFTLDDVSSYGITSADDVNYSSSQSPSDAIRVMFSRGEDLDRNPISPEGEVLSVNGFYRPAYYVYCYVQFPTAMVDGDTYTITVSGTKTATFLFDRKKTISRAIKVNQAGYLPSTVSRKAYIGAYLYDKGVLDLNHALTAGFEVINADTGSVALSGSVTLSETNPIYNPLLASGTTDGVGSNKLIDAGASFLSTAQVGYYALDDSDNATEILGVDSDSQLSMSNTAYNQIGKNYRIVQYPDAADTREMYGEDVYEIDFSSLVATGTFYISVPGVGRSWPFEHSTTAYDYAAYTQIRGLYHHRNGLENTTKYTYWPRRKARTGPYYYKADHLRFPYHDQDVPSGWDHFDVIGGTLDRNDPIAQEPGGWHDAADWDDQQGHFLCAYNLMYLFQFNTGIDHDDWLDIPESGDGIPDLLSEARHGINLWRIAQKPDGSVPGWLEAFTHGDIDSTRTTTAPLGSVKIEYAFSQRTRWDALTFAACAAQYARLIKPYDLTDSALFETAAIDAYNYGKNAANTLGSISIDWVEDRGKGPGSGTFPWTEIESHHEPYLMHAKLQLWLLTGTDTYITEAPSVATLEPRIHAQPFLNQWGPMDFSGWLYYSIIEAFNAGYTGLSAQAATWSAWFIARAEDLVDATTNQPYEKASARGLGPLRWGVGSPTRDTVTLVIAHQETGLAKYKDAIARNLDFMFGCNPLGMSWTTGIGYVYPPFITSQVGWDDGIEDPIPGIALYGNTTDPDYSGGDTTDLKQTIWRNLGTDSGGVTSIIQTGGTATVTTSANHLLTTGNRIEIAGATESEYNIQAVCTVTGLNTFEYSVDSGASSPATGSPTWYYYFATPKQSGQERPMWRRFFMHQTLNIAQCEYTVHETIGPLSLACGYLATTGVATQKTPRDPQYLWGKWHLV